MKLVIRADASIKTGTGHAMRCLALAQTWNNQGGETIFLMVGDSSNLKTRFQSEGIQVVYLPVEVGGDEDAQQTADIAKKAVASWVVVDGYCFDFKYQKSLKNYGLNVLFVDDYGHANYYYADLILNQNISANQKLYINRETYTKLLLGTKYTLLRKEFWQRQSRERVFNLIASKILVTLGGSDPDNVTLKVIQALSLVNNNLEVIVVVGGSNPHYEELQAVVTESNLVISLQQNVNNMPELMDWADLAIAAGGSTNWELAFMGLPSIVITIADNQKAIAAELDRHGVIINLGWHQDVTVEQIGFVLRELISDRPKRETMSKKGRELVDGNGAKRVISKINSMSA
ncbi:MAG: UDP-2,4-diacetamido-2,4,6-trideoxy-beta-L-altropyranose hydrolase [Pseudanabaena sp. M57BS1SP1A06MG]|nr:UDP-2,4-diacetamido-2,4,6-trideoxy-beta-L-altropyranose hydrolase [Pseudanabaena sp. M53BS1SP1A06MG]MCA6583287.1 UDP-2,4-diacetamido-2,4,6-trideoxy-beta-L-altropyranose hydrolase [Pseudanabaena sp. M34BS1SP1A06MG]MCA6591061.1 UDP-2,4-diacetamido-2,4,6-trideoxy-beta-L-altropyranose hydrolase [Pseudanabaena sp. M38BS1SP1A06MG]MCA6601119.1 UDP-2,4-diacetamido-2,4,6-trideoxy-beta-L-altropyranose hydrolase [Pseudanabaena sp. M57BS1SP1A06MG]